MESDFAMTEYERWDEPSNKDNGHLVVRETPAAKVREQWAQIRLTVHQMTLERDLAFAHVSDNLDYTLEPIASLPPKPLSWFETVMENLSVRWCRFAHREPVYRRGDQYSECPTCKRRYALPWADMSKVENNVYVPSAAFVGSNGHTLQVKCRNGWMGEV